MSTSAVLQVLKNMPASARLGVAVNILRILVADWETLVEILGLGDPRAHGLANAADEVGRLVNNMFGDVPGSESLREQLVGLQVPLDEVWERVDTDLRQVDWALRELANSVT